MDRVAHVWPEPVALDGAEVEVAARVAWPTAWWTPLVDRKAFATRRQRVFVRVPPGTEVSEVAAGDAMLLGTVFGAMRRARVLRVHGPVTRDLLVRLRTLVDGWVCRDPRRYGPVELVADAEVDGPVATGPAVLPFSGGLDSAYSLRRRTGPGAPTDAPPVATAVMLHGADVPVAEADAFERTFARAVPMARARGVALVRATTNLRVVKQHWSHSVTAALGAVLGLFRARHGLGLVAVGFTPEEADRWWPQDRSDPPLVGSPTSFEVRGDGWEADRFQKVEAVADWPEALEGLRVCYRPGVYDRNCSRCFKCLMVMAFFQEVLGQVPPCFSRQLEDEDARHIARCGDPNVGLRVGQLLAHARRRGGRSPWVARLADEVRAAGLPLPEAP